MNIEKVRTSLKTYLFTEFAVEKIRKYVIVFPKFRVFRGSLKEIYYGMYTYDKIQSILAMKSALMFKTKRPVLVGTDCLLKVNMNIGVSNEADYDKKIQKLVKISNLSYRPDTMELDIFQLI